ncbi:MAG: DnaJ domain-containing protein [Lachnospiraceae bacterium]|jgi:curved DNA-binding protein|nr:DnaJ domain-containing protein [Lachnospiraceae bacterium]
MVFKDYYKILGLDTNKVTVEELKIAYREQAKKYHPDVNVGNLKTEERFKDINEAYKLLSDVSKRKKYDRNWNSYIGKKKVKQEKDKSSSDEDIFSIFFGASKDKEEVKTKKKVIVKGENIETEIDIGIEEAYYGMEKKISLRSVDGKMKVFNIKIPAGIRNKEKIRLIGQGKNGINGGKNGDLFIKINIQDNDKFRLSGYNLKTNLYLTPSEAALGTRIDLIGIDEKISLHIPAGIESSQMVKIAGKGYKDGKGSRGDLLAEVKIMVPKQLSEEEKDLYKKISEISKFNPRK